jgi:transmembrane sensor
VFENDSVSSVVAQFNRYNHVQIHVTDAALSARPISGVFDATDPESFIAFFQSVAAVRVDRGDDHINISPR